MQRKAFAVYVPLWSPRKTILYFRKTVLSLMLVECASFRLLTSGAGAGQNQRYPKDYEMGQEPWKKCRKAPKLLSLGPCEERNTLANMLSFFFCSFGSRECIWMDEARCNLGTEVHDWHG